MPATAGRVRMPANNRVHSSAALQTHGIWQSAIGYDPYAPDQKQAPPPASGGDRDDQISAPSADQQNAYDSFQGLLALARLTGSNADEARGACRKCGRVGHLPFQCRNFLVLKDELAAAAAAASNVGSYADGGNGSSHHKDRAHSKHQREGGVSASVVSDLSSEEDESSETDESGLSDSSEDSEMERAIAAKLGKNVLNSLSRKTKSAHSKEQSRRKRSHSKKSKARKGVDDSASSEEDLKKARNRVKSSKRSRKEVEDSGSEEEASESESEREHRRKRRRHSHKHGKSRRKHRSKHSEEASKGRRHKRLKAKGSSRRHSDRTHE